MKLSKALLLGSILLTTFKASLAQDEVAQSESALLKCPNEIIVAISSYLEPQDNLNFRQTCKDIDECVNFFYQEQLRKGVNTFLGQDNNTSPHLPLDYLNRLLTSILQKDGYLFTPQNSDLEKHLYKHYSFINLYPFLQKDRVWAGQLFQALFGKPMPEEKTDLALNLLTACLPIKHIYSAEGANTSVVVQKFKEKTHDSLIATLKSMGEQHSYFLIDIDEDKERLATKPHHIVVTQLHTSGFQTLDQEEYFPTNNLHTLIYNADQEILTSPALPVNISKLILTNGNSQCTSIGNNFLKGYNNLDSLDIVGLNNVTSIGHHFLSNCESLTSFDAERLTNLTLIGHMFLSNCKSLASFDTQGLTKVTSIGNGFLSGCKSLASFDTQGLTNVTSIKNYFLFGCKNLTSFDTRGLTNVTSIGPQFLGNCKSLTSFDTRGLTKVTLIDVSFLSDCESLTSFDTQGLTNVISIKDYFLSDCKSLTSFDTRGLINLTSIRNRFLDRCENLTSFDTQGLSNVTSIGNYFLSNCKRLTSFDTQGLTNVTLIGYSFLDASPLSSQAEELKQQILERRKK